MKYVLGNQPENNQEAKVATKRVELQEVADSAEDSANAISAEHEKAMKVDRRFMYEDKDKRELNAKHYVGNDGTVTAIFSNKAVHYLDDQTQEFKEVDNSLTDTGDKLETKSNTFKTRFKKRSADGELFEVTRGKCRVGFKSHDLAKNCACEADNCTCEETNAAESKMLFKDVREGVDIQYIVDSDRVKENIIVKNKCEEYEFDFSMNIENLDIGVSDDGKTLQLMDKETGEVRFYIPAPFMTDAAGAHSDLVCYEIAEQSADTLNLKVIADNEWINAENRAFPVTIDPQIVTQDSSILVYEYQELVKKSNSGSMYDKWEAIKMPTLQFVKIDEKHRLNISINKYRFAMPKKSIIKAQLSFNFWSGKFYIQDNLYDFSGTFGHCVYDITDEFKNNTSNTINVQIYSKGTDAELYGSKNMYKLTIEYLENDTEPEKKTFLLCGGAVNELNIVTGESVCKIPDVQVGNENIPFAVFHLFKPNETDFHCGKNCRLNLHQTLVKSGKDYVYTDENGWTHLVKEKFYIIRDNKREEVMNYSVDSDGVMTYTAEYKGYLRKFKVYRELQTKGGLRVVTRLDGEGTEFIEQRQDEEKQAEESLNSYKNAIEDLRRVSTETGTIDSTLPDLTSDNLKSFFNTNDLILSCSEALQFESLCLNNNNPNTSIPNNIQSQINAIIDSKQVKYEYAYNLYKEYLVKKQELEQIQRQLPVAYVINGEEILGFNKFGNLCAITNGAGAYLTVQWGDIITKDGKVEAITAVSAGERTTTFTYDFNGNLSSITNFNGDRIEYQYSPHGAVLVKIKYPMGRYLIVPSGNGSSRITDDKYNECKWTCIDGKLVSITNSSKIKSIADGGVKTSNSYQIVSKSTVTYGDNYVAINTDDTTEYILLDENKKSYASYVKQNGQIHDLQAYTNIESMYSFTVMPKKRKDMLNENSEVSIEITDAFFDALPDITSFPDMTDEYFSYGEADWEATEYDSFNRPVTTRTNWRYNGIASAGKPVYVYKQIDYEYDVANIDVPCLKKTTTTYINTSGLQDKRAAREIIQVENYSYNDFNKLCRTESYIEGEENTKGVTVTEKIYDENGNVTKEYTYNTLDSSTKFYTESEKSENGAVLADLDETGENKTSYEYEKGAVRQITNPNGSKFAYGYDESGNVTAISQSTECGEENSTNIKYTSDCPTRLTSGNNVVYYEYDYKRRKTKVTVNGTETCYAYDDDNDVTTATFAGHTFTSQKDKDGNIVNTQIDGATQLEYAYEDGLLKSVTDCVTNIRTEYEYSTDKTDKLIQVSNEKLSEYYDYNPFGDITIKTITGEVSQAYAYYYKDNATREINCIVLPGNIICYPKTDVNGRNTGKELYKGQNKVYGEYISYRKVGDHGTNMPSAIWYAHGTAIKDNIKYKYDKCGNIIEIRENGELKARYEYDSLNRLIREDNKVFDSTWLFDYDCNGNITSKRVTNFTLSSSIEQKEFEAVTYSYDGDRLMSYNGEAISYDTYGNPILYRGNTLEWQYGKRLAKFGDTTFGYDGQGRRVSKGNITYIYDSNGKLLKQSNGLEFIYDSNGLSGFKYNGVNYIYRKNLQGDITHILDTSGTIWAEYAYDAWGNTIAIITSEIGELNPFRYRGYYYDAETGLYYLKTRYYDPGVGRFISQDDVTYLDPETINGLNLFAYCGDNPVMGYDPDGTIGIFLTILIATIAGAVINSVLSVAEQLYENDWDFKAIDLNEVGRSALIGAATGFAFGVGGAMGAAVKGAVTLSSFAMKALVVSAVAVNAIAGMGAYAIEWAGTESFNPIGMILHGASQAGSGAFNVFIGSMFGASGVWPMGKSSGSLGLLISRSIVKSALQFFFDKMFNNWGF